MSVDALSDAELRSKLIKYGYPVGPVTQTTRNILLKKLKNLMEIRSGTESRHSLAARYFYFIVFLQLFTIYYYYLISLQYLNVSLNHLFHSIFLISLI